MTRQLGRISGGVLEDNLLRQGVNLNFKNRASDTALLHLDVTNNRIGINDEGPTDRLNVPTTVGTVGLVADTYANIDTWTIENNEISIFSGNIILDSQNEIQVSTLDTDDFRISDNTIKTKTPNTNIEIRPDGSGTLEIQSNWNITGNLYTPNNITFEGNITIGNENTDSVTFNADIINDIIPDVANTYSLGSGSKKWLNIYSNLLNGQRVEVDSITVNDASLALRQGNIFYVSVNGDDTNKGDHQHSPFRTIKRALEFADASSDGPVTIHIYPGEYEEVVPLTVPERVTVQGEDLRNTIVKPTVATQTNDIFELNQNTTIENITVKDFYSPGHAFVFASSAVITERSPYVRNVSVITQGSVTSASDPRGFLSGDAGKGALVDGSVVDNATPTPSMLFHSVTFITPGVDAITMTNGVRIEWLNSFTYFANRGLYATQGSLGKASLGSTFGAEIRSIGSANVYGNYGAVADGADTLMYLISHNFAYIGAGGNVTNDRTLTLFDQETQKLNNGKIYYTSTDADGTFRVGNAFYVDFTTGETSIDADNINFDGISAIFINTGGSITYIDGEKVELGNIRISGNTIETLDGDLLFSPTTGVLNLYQNDIIKIPRGDTSERRDTEGGIRYNTDDDLYEGFTSANVAFGGVYSDDRQTNIKANRTTGTLDFTANGSYVGSVISTGLSWNGIGDEDILFKNNLVTTTLSNSNLELRRETLTKVVNIYDIDLKDNIIENTSSNNFSLFSTNAGYIKFDYTGGLKIPAGDTSSQPVSPEIGDTRWNTEVDYLETWNGTEWQRSAGTGPVVTEEVMTEFLDIYTLVLG